MKLWKVSFHTAHDGMLIAWRGSLLEAQECGRQFRKKYGAALGPDVIDAVNIPTNKAGLLAWLNAHFNTDNG